MRKILGYSSEFSIFALVASVLIVGPLNFGSREFEGQALLHVLILAMLPFWILRLSCLAEPTFVWTRGTLPALAFVGYMAIWYVCGGTQWLARQELLTFVSYLILFLAVVNNLQRRWQLQALFWIIAAVAGAEAADAIFRSYHGSLGTVCRFFFFDCIERGGFQNQWRAGGTFYTADHFSACLEIGLVLVAAHLVVLKRSWTRKIFLAYLGACILYGIALSRSRGGWITVLCLVPFMVGLVARGRFLNFRSALVGMLVLAGVVLLLYLKHGLVADRLNDLFTQGEPTRLKFYRAALAIGKENPLFGVGPRQFNIEFHKHYLLMENPEFVHSEYLQLWAEYGIVGIGLIGWLLVALFQSAFRICAPNTGEPVSNVSKDVSQRLALALGGTAAAFAIGIHAIFDFVLHVMGIGVTIVTVIAMMYAGAAWRRKRSEVELEAFGFEEVVHSTPLSVWLQRIVPGALGVVFLLLGPLSVRNYLALYYERQAERVQVRLTEWDDPETVFQIEQKAARVDPGSSRAAFVLAAHYAGLVGDDLEANRAMYEQALRWLGKTIRNDSNFVPGYELRAQLYLSAQDTKNARADCEKLVAMRPFNPQYHITLGEICFREADYACARKQFELAHKFAVEMTSPLAEPAMSYLELLKDVPRPEDADAN